ncbi:unnamed protein product, partial [Laminaria digitata]
CSIRLLDSVTPFGCSISLLDSVARFGYSIRSLYSVARFGSSIRCITNRYSLTYIQSQEILPAPSSLLPLPPLTFADASLQDGPAVRRNPLGPSTRHPKPQKQRRRQPPPRPRQ